MIVRDVKKHQEQEEEEEQPQAIREKLAPFTSPLGMAAG
jgi:hypothetical protein